MNTRRGFLNRLSKLLLLPLAIKRPPAPARPPNFVIIFFDDLGYSDLGCFGAKGYETPNIDRMAREGVRLTDFYVAQAVCSASRAALMTGCYSNRVSITGALFPDAKNGLNPNEMTIPKLLKTRGYATGMCGKWHLGSKPQFMPTKNGFDEYFGLPYSNDMWPGNPNARTRSYPPLPLIEGEKVVAENPDQAQFTTQYSEHAVKFIERNRDKPFFLYVAHTMPHVPLGVSSKFKGKTSRGIYGDVVAELDWSTGQILQALKRNGIDDQTLVIVTSDNGPWAEYGDHGGSAGELRGSKGTSFEGGVREPFIARWPKRIPAGSVSHVPAMTIDLLPTIARLAGAELPKDRIIDGRDIGPLLEGKRKGEVHEVLYFYWGYELHGVRSGKWKLHVPHPSKEVTAPASGGMAGTAKEIRVELSLYDLEKDVGETKNVAERNPEVVARLMRLVEEAREDIGDSLTNRKGKNVRPAG
jgi:arylsulfatase A